MWLEPHASEEGKERVTWGYSPHPSPSSFPGGLPPSSYSPGGVGESRGGAEGNE